MEFERYFVEKLVYVLKKNKCRWAEGGELGFVCYFFRVFFWEKFFRFFARVGESVYVYEGGVDVVVVFFVDGDEEG